VPNIYSILTKSQELLKEANIVSYRLDAEILLFHVLNIDKTDFVRDPHIIIPQNKIDEFNLLINKRLEFVPVAKLIGKKEFYSLEFKVNQHVLDPRPDTETLIDAVLKYLPNQKENLAFLDMGTGSGNIAITLATLYCNTQLTAIDISVQALEIARENAKEHNVGNNILFKKSNFFENVKGKYDLIISNPPYIETKTIDSLDKEVKLFDPMLALDGGNDGLHCYKLIADNAVNFLNKNGYIILEIGYNQKDLVIKVFENHGYILKAQIKDLGKNNRCLVFTH